MPAARAVAAGLTVMPADLWNGAERVALSHREREVLRLAVTGRTNAEIASTLFLAEHGQVTSLVGIPEARGRRPQRRGLDDLRSGRGLADMVLRREDHESLADGIPAA